MICESRRLALAKAYVALSLITKQVSYVYIVLVNKARSWTNTQKKWRWILNAMTLGFLASYFPYSFNKNSYITHSTLMGDQFEEAAQLLPSEYACLTSILLLTRMLWLICMKVNTKWWEARLWYLMPKWSQEFALACGDNLDPVFSRCRSWKPVEKCLY